MADKDIYTELMGRHAAEAQRLDEQFRLITGYGLEARASKTPVTDGLQSCSALGWILHPSITRRLGNRPSIADFATGTGLCLRLLSDFYPGARLDGYDISPEMFAADEKVNLSVANAKEPLPAELHGVYNVVHIRCLIVGMDPEEWEPVLRNMVQLLKPGGAIQWTEPALSQLRYIRGEPYSRTSTMNELLSMLRGGPLQQRCSHGWSTLPAIMEKCGLEVETDVVSSDRQAEAGRASTENHLKIPLSFLRMMAAKQAPGALSSTQIDEMEAEAIKEVESGSYVRYDLHTAIGFKLE
ncbi:MAG: hypothetical protein Q9182_005256 [Xanthomendoza sp. 2 TL-2023]